MVSLGPIEDFFFSVLNTQQEKEKLISKCGAFKAQEWGSLFDLAVRIRLLPVFYSRLLSLNLIVPPDFLSRLKNIFLLNLKRNIMLEQELFNVMGFLKARGIAHVPLKGPVLARLLYGDISLRHTSVDLDILVAKGNLLKTEKALIEFGYNSRNEDEVNFLRALKLKYARQLHVFKHIDGIGNLNLDLHCDLRGFFVDTAQAGFWHNLRNVTLNGHNVLVPSYEDMLLFLSQVSLSTFEFVELRYLYDIHQLLTAHGQALDWEQVFFRSAQYNLDPYLYFSLFLTKDYFLTAVPSEFLRKIQPGIAKRYIMEGCFNATNVIFYSHRVASSYYWQYLLSTLIPARGGIDFIRRLYRKVFLPMEEVMGFYGRYSGRRSYFLYGKRLLKPFFRLFKKREDIRKISINNPRERNAALLGSRAIW